MTGRLGGSEPTVTFAMAAYNAAPYVAAAVQTALDQTGVVVEVIVVDDASTDATAEIVAAIAAADDRVRLLRNAATRGPAAARNRALEAASGTWIAILDADDLLDADRTRALLDLADGVGCEVVADNILRFRAADGDADMLMLPKDDLSTTRHVGLGSYLRANLMTGGPKNYGYLKPMFLRSFLETRAIRYDESLRIGEDFNFCLKTLVAGARMAVTPAAFYRYRMLSNSLSRRLSVADIEAMKTAYDTLAVGDTLSSAERGADRAYRRSLAEMRVYLRFREGMRARDWPNIAWRAANPMLWSAVARLGHSRMRQRVAKLI